MTYPWPLTHPEAVLDEALDIALNFVESAGDSTTRDSKQHLVANAILKDWQKGTREKISLANVGIVAVQKQTETKVSDAGVLTVTPRFS
jgi:hypothetical protein